MSYPALVERALRLVEASGGGASEQELCEALFGGSGPAWSRLLGQVLAADGRLRPAGGGTWVSARRPSEARSAFAVGAPLALQDGLAAVGLVVLAAGPKPWRHPIVAIGAARGGVCFETLVQPAQPCRVPKYLEKLGVRSAELDEAPTLRPALERLLEFVGDARLVGLDVGVAVARLQFALRSVGLPPLDNPTTELAVGGESKPDLAALARARGVPVPSRLTPGVLAQLALKLDCAGAPRSDGTALGATAWRRLLDARGLAEIPASPGVYLFRDRTGKLLYVGKAASLRNRLASYLTGQFALVRSMPGLVEATERLEHETLPCELSARAREAELIAAHRPTYNVQRRPDPALAWARLVLDGSPAPDGVTVPRLKLELASEPSDGAVLATVAAARAAFRRARKGWWPPRPRREERPTSEAVDERVARLRGEVLAELRRTPVGPGIVAADLAGGLRVEAPVRPARLGAEVEADEEAWTRLRVDREWPPRELVDGDADWNGTDVEEDEPADEEPGPVTFEVRPSNLSALSVVLSALRRGETGVRAWAK